VKGLPKPTLREGVEVEEVPQPRKRHEIAGPM
jgi:hypothetical protein